MTFDLLALAPYTLIPVMGIMGKLLFDRLSRIETKAEASVSEPQVRQLLADKLEPLQEDIKEIKESVRGLIERTYANPRTPQYVSTRTSDRE